MDDELGTSSFIRCFQLSVSSVPCPARETLIQGRWNTIHTVWRNYRLLGKVDRFAGTEVFQKIFYPFRRRLKLQELGIHRNNKRLRLYSVIECHDKNYGSTRCISNSVKFFRPESILSDISLYQESRQLQ